MGPTPTALYNLGIKGRPATGTTSSRARWRWRRARARARAG